MNRAILHLVLRIARRYRGTVALIFVIGITQTFIGNYAVVAFQRLIDGFSAANSLPALSPLLAVYIVANLTNHILIYIEGIPATILDRGAGQWVRLRALEKIARIDYQSYQNLGTGNLIQVIENGSEAVRKIATGFYLGTLRRSIPQVIIGLYFIQIYDRALFIAAVIGYVLFSLVANGLMRYLRGAVEAMLSRQEDFSKFSVRAFMELVVFRVNGRFRAEVERLQGISDEIVRARAKVYLLQELAYTGFALLLFLVEVGVVIQQAGKIMAGTSTVGTLVALVAFVKIVFWPVIEFGQSWMEYKLNAVTFVHLERVLDMPDDPGLSRAGQLVVEQGSIVFDHVSFAYGGREVLRDFSFTIPGGQVTAFVGASGSGKSTLVRLLLHLLKPSGGRVLVDGQDLAQVNLEAYYQQIAYIPQDPPIFDGTVRENLVFDRPVSAQQVEEAVAWVELDGWVRRLPRGLDTLVGERGIKLSGGERQRLAFARVTLQDPRIVILDEPTSALDSLTEDAVSRRLAVFLRGRTVIVIAHRLQTVRSADRIVVLEEGQVIQCGTFSELVASEGRFKEMWQAQQTAPSG